MTIPMACSKSGRLASDSSPPVRSTGVKERVRGRHRVVDLVGHHTNQLLVRTPFGLTQLLCQFFDEEKASREAAIDERAMMALDTACAAQGHDLRLLCRQRRENPR